MWKRESLIDHLHARRPVIAPSLLKCDFGNLKRELELLDAADASLLHLDVMDGHFVPNLSYGPMVIERMRPLTRTPFDAHLMVSNPEDYLDDYLKAGCDAVTVHLEVVPDPRSLLAEIRRNDRVAGLAINPDTDIAMAEPFLEDCDLFLVMSVQPGFGGQSFQGGVLPRVVRARERAGERLLISIDGGINAATIGTAAAAGVDLYVAGSAVFDEADYEDAMQRLHDIAVASAPDVQGTTAPWPG